MTKLDDEWDTYDESNDGDVEEQEWPDIPETTSSSSSSSSSSCPPILQRSISNPSIDVWMCPNDDCKLMNQKRLGTLLETCTLCGTQYNVFVCPICKSSENTSPSFEKSSYICEHCLHTFRVDFACQPGTALPRIFTMLTKQYHDQRKITIQAYHNRREQEFHSLLLNDMWEPWLSSVPWQDSLRVLIVEDKDVQETTNTECLSVTYSKRIVEQRLAHIHRKKSTIIIILHDYIRVFNPNLKVTLDRWIVLRNRSHLFKRLLQKLPMSHLTVCPDTKLDTLATTCSVVQALSSPYKEIRHRANNFRINHNSIVFYRWVQTRYHNFPHDLITHIYRYVYPELTIYQFRIEGRTRIVSCIKASPQQTTSNQRATKTVSSGQSAYKQNLELPECFKPLFIKTVTL
jgi:hypothetical protein